MTATEERYRITFASEMLLGRHPSCNCYLGCGVSTAFHGIDDATLGEYTTLSTGARMAKAGRTSKLRAGWRGFKLVADSNGIPDTDDYIRIHRAMAAKGMPDPERFWTRNWDDVVDKMQAGFGVSIALRLSALPSDSPARRYTAADHQQYLQKRLRNDKVKDVCPMHPHSTRYSGHPVPLQDLKVAAKAISGGLILTWLYPRGGWTAEKLRAQSLRQRIRKLVGDLEDMAQKRDHLRDRRDELNVKLAECRAEISMLTAQLEDCQRDNGADCSDEVKAAYDSAISAIEDLRDEP